MNRSIGIAPRSTSLAIGRDTAVGWTATRTAGLDRTPMRRRSLSRRWRRRSRLHRSVSSLPFAIRIITHLGSRVFAIVKRRSFAPPTSEERRVGKEWVRTCEYRGAPHYSKKKQQSENYKTH